MTRPIFLTEANAINWMLAQVNDPCVDNVRIAYKDDHASLKRYRRAKRRGCCGSYDSYVIIGLRAAKVGCNYGH